MRYRLVDWIIGIVTVALAGLRGFTVMTVDLLGWQLICWDDSWFTGITVDLLGWQLICCYDSWFAGMTVDLLGWQLICCDDSWFPGMTVDLLGWQLICCDDSWFTGMTVDLLGWQLIYWDDSCYLVCLCFPKLIIIRSNQNITQNLPPNWIISFLEVYKDLMHCFIVFPFSLKYLTNAQYMISSWAAASQSTLLIPNNFLYIWS
jgi:hypothetical protein